LHFLQSMTLKDAEFTATWLISPTSIAFLAQKRLHLAMAQSPRKIVFSIPSLVPDRPVPRAAERAAPRTMPMASGRDGDRKKLATLMEVGEALAGTLNLQAGLYGVLEVLERRCGALRGTVALLEEETGLLAV
jgi:hypothetical protein